MPITILVGPHRSRYFAHKEVLVKKSPFFAKCLDAGMKEEHSNEVDFPDDTCRAFDLFFVWIYSREVPQVDSHDKVLAAMDAWVLADKLVMPDWQNPLIDGIMSFWKRRTMSPEHLAWLYDNACESSLLFTLGSKQLVWDMAFEPSHYEGQWLVELEELLAKRECSPAELICSVIREKKEEMDWNNQPAAQGCTYHVHLCGKPC
jgi:hypothetical protein